MRIQWNIIELFASVSSCCSVHGAPCGDLLRTQPGKWKSRTGMLVVSSSSLSHREPYQGHGKLCL